MKTTIFEPLTESLQLGDRAYNALLRAIVSGQIELGAQLPLDSIAAQFDISVTPVREALNRLERDRIVVKVPHRGWLVREFSEQEVREIYELRIGLERFTVGMACNRITAPELRWLEEHQLRGEADILSGDMDDYWAYNRDLHGAILRAAHNSELSTLMGQLSMKAQMLTAATIRMAGRPPRAVREHRELIRLIGEHKPAEAQELIERHLASALEDILRVGIKSMKQSK